MLLPRRLSVPFKPSSLLICRPFSISHVSLSGHNKWSTIKHDKAKNDALKNATATKFSNAIAVAAKLGGPDPNINFKLSTAIEAANKANVSKKVIENAIKRGSGTNNTAQENVEFALYEGMANGVSFIVEALTNNKARSAAMIKACFTKINGSFAPTLYQFTKRGYIIIDSSLDQIMESSTIEEFNIEDIEEYNDQDDISILYTNHQDTGKIVENLRNSFKIQDFGIEYSPNEDTIIPKSSLNEEKLLAHQKILTNLQDLDDVTQVYTNLA